MTEPISDDVLAELERRIVTHEQLGSDMPSETWELDQYARPRLRALIATARRHAELLAGIEGRLLAIQLEASLSRIGSHEELCRSLESIRDEAAAALRQLKEQTHG